MTTKQLTDAECDAITHTAYGYRCVVTDHDRRVARAAYAAGAASVAVPRERAIHLYRIGDYAIVSVEHEKRWVEVMREHVDGAFSHIVEPLGIQSKIDAAPARQDQGEPK